jgi:2-C-methyl-D-erythritol 2,4-cyclodiphosphate synthase
VHAKRPKLRPYIEEMRKNLSEDLQVSVGQISVKATTTERLGFVVREEGIAAEAVVLLQSVSWKKSYGS